ncbi:MAG: hypothetical protein U1F25_07185 [Rubrivivax sp.]
MARFLILIAIVAGVALWLLKGRKRVEPPRNPGAANTKAGREPAPPRWSPVRIAACTCRGPTRATTPKACRTAVNRIAWPDRAALERRPSPCRSRTAWLRADAMNG